MTTLLAGLSIVSVACIFMARKDWSRTFAAVCALFFTFVWAVDSGNRGRPTWFSIGVLWCIAVGSLVTPKEGQ